MTTTAGNQHQLLRGHANAQRDAGFTLMEMLLVVTILGILGSVLVLSLTGMSTDAADVGCQADRHNVQVAAEAYFAQTGVKQIPATGFGHDRFEQTLVDGGFLRSGSSFHDLDTNGIVTPQGSSPC